MTTRLILGLLIVMAGLDTASARMVSDKERMRQQAEHLCYNDVQRLCNAEIPDEARIEACMKVHRAQLSPGCRKVFDTGLK
jgi:hypothetical protein